MKNTFEKKMCSNGVIGIWRVGGDVKFPVFVVARDMGSYRGSILFTCSGEYALENARKRYNWIAFGTPYRDSQRKSNPLVKIAKGILRNIL